MSNKILQLKGSFKTDGNHTKPAAPNIPEKGLPVNVDHLRDLKQQLEEILKYWKSETLIGGALISVYYNKIVAKRTKIAHTSFIVFLTKMRNIRIFSENVRIFIRKRSICSLIF